MNRILALCALVALPTVVGCSPSADFWERGPGGGGGANYNAAPSTPYRPANRPQYQPRPRRQAPRPAPRRAPSAKPRYAPAPRQAPQPIPTPRAPSRYAATAEDHQTLQHVNAIRRRRGLRPFRYNAQLFVAAFDHSAEQRRHGYMGHGSPDPRRRRLASRMKLAGYHGKAFAEVVAYGYKNVASVVRGWMNSPGHRDILLDPKLQEAAFSRVGDYWTGNFGTPYTRRVPRPRRTPAARPAPTPAPTPRAAPRFSPPAYKPAVPPPTQPAPSAGLG